ncbi:hypothetical protein FOCC_FOCC010907 [Frankliniella occidentalis]|nr:hypothetical protein FOCC_FOCC010907 [Frankliniella occidentalis]
MGKHTTAPYSEWWTLAQLRKRYAGKLLVNERPGRCTLLCFGEKASDILSSAWYQQKRASEVGERQRIVETAAAIIRDDIRRHAYDVDQYPTVPEVEEGGWEALPKSLRTLLTELICKGKKGKQAPYILKCNMIGQAIVSAARPRSFLSPLQHALSVYLHRSFASRHLVDLLHSLGVCSSYTDAANYEKSIIEHAKPAITDTGNVLVQFVFDNADFDISTIDGLNTFHVMGGIKCITPATSVSLEFTVPRSSGYQKVDVALHGSIPLANYKPPPESGFQKITVEDLRPGQPYEFKATATSAPCKKSAILPVPFINLEATNPTTICTALEYAAAESEAVKQKTTIVTFDHPLFMKTTEMVLAAAEGSPLKSIVISLGGFHLLMSFMHAISYLMAGSGLEEMWGTAYAPKTVPHMMSAKAFSRAVRGHFLAQSCIFALLSRKAAYLDRSRKNCLSSLFNEVSQSKVNFEAAANDERLKEAVCMLDTVVRDLSSGRLGRLWLNYFEHVNTLRAFILAQKTGNWGLHLLSIRKMRPVFHAAGHLPYAKAAQIYLQQVSSLETKMHPLEFDKYTRGGGFVIRRFDRYFCGVWPDLVIEQSLMRALKVKSGLTHGRGITEATKSTFIHAMPLTTLLTRALESYTGKSTLTSEQHVDLRESRQIRDQNDLTKMLGWLQAHDPFQECQDLRSLSSGIKATAAVNCDMSLEVGVQAMSRSIGKKYGELTLHRKDRATNLASVRPAVQIRGEEVQVNGETVLHRVRCVVADVDLGDCFKYELGPVPSSLFDKSGFMHKGTKSTLAQVLQSSAVLSANANPLYVLDGGHLLQRVSWPRPATYAQVAATYSSFVQRLYTSRSTVVFDGYAGGPSVKDVEHMRRGAKNMSADIKVEPNLPVVTTQAKFLTNGKNKEQLIALLSHDLREKGVTVVKAPGDADRLIATTAIELTKTTGENVVVVGNDTDVLALLIALSDGSESLSMLMPGKKSKVYDIPTIRMSLGDAADLLVLHALTGCDSTSAPYNKGKKDPLQKLQDKEEFRRIISIFNSEGASAEEIATAGEAFLLSLYGSSDQFLDVARFSAYLRTVAKKPISSDIDMKYLPPSSAAARQHSFRAYYQVQEWRGAELDPTKWGWKVVNNIFQPVMTLLPPAPPEVLELSACGCAGNCSTRRCSCYAAGRKCSAMCGKCNGVTCGNAMREVGQNL